MNEAEYRSELQRIAHLIELDRSSDALARLDALPDGARDANAMRLRAAAYVQLSNWAAAIDAGRQAVILSPNEAASHSVVASGFHGAGDLKTAADAAWAAVQLDPDDAEYWRLLAFILSDSGQFAGAYDAALRAVELAPDEPVAHFALGYVCQHNDPATARLAYLRCLELDPHHQAAALNLSLLNTRRQPDQVINTVGRVLGSGTRSELPLFMLDDIVARTLFINRLLILLTCIIGVGAPPSAAAVVGLLGAGATLAVAVSRIRPIIALQPFGVIGWTKSYAKRDPFGFTWLAALSAAWVALLFSAGVGLAGLTAQWPFGIGIVICFITVPLPLARRFLQTKRINRLQHSL